MRFVGLTSCPRKAWLAVLIAAGSVNAPTFAQPAAEEVETATEVAEQSTESAELPERLLDRDPFDRITLDAANDNAVIETVLLDLPERRVPNPLPEGGALELRRLSHPSIPYSVDWSAVEKIELYEQMLLAEAERLTAANEFGEAFEYLAFLAMNYSKLAGLEEALQRHLWREASTAFAAGRRDEAWSALNALFLRNPQYPRLVNAVQAVSDQLISVRLEEKNYAAARAILDQLESSFSGLPLANIARWRQQFQTDAQTQLARARAALANEQYSDARDAVTYARSILPTIEGGAELWEQIQNTAPEVRVGVTQTAAPGSPWVTPTLATARVSDLVDPRLVEMVDFGAEGGVYASRWGEVQTSDSGLETTVRLAPTALSRGLRPDMLALRLVEMAGVDGSRRQEDFAALAEKLSVGGGQDVKITWRRPHVRPAAFLQTPLRWLTTADRGPGLWFEPVDAEPDAQEYRYQRSGPPTDAKGEPRYVVERVFADDGEALDALMRGDVDVVDRVPPWEVARIERAPEIVVAPYRLPTVHVLIPNTENPLLDMREFRRAICYGIDGEGIVRDILLGGQARAGFRTLSGPFPAGIALNDPAGYAYNAEVPTRPYEPRLASLLAGVARTTLAKREAEKKKAQEAAVKAKEAAKTEKSAGAAAENPAEKPKAAESPPEEPAPLPPPAPLVLAHGADPIARLACQSIKIQLDLVGIPIKLAEFVGGAPPADMKYDLLYAELAVWEPVVDARRLLGPQGVAGKSTALMSLALDELARSENWNQARSRLNEIHRIAHYDLPLLPLWQTVNHLAYRKSLAGVGASPVSLYQNVSAWRKSFE